MAIQTRKMTASDFLALPETNLPHELINGEEIMSPAPSVEHQRLLIRLFDLLRKLIPNGEVFVAPLDVLLDDANVPQPDILWIAADNTNAMVHAKYVQGPPDLVVEIFSPGSARRDKKDKFRVYERFGVRGYWMVDPAEKLLEIWQLEDNRFILADVFGPGDACQSALLGSVDMKAVFPE